MTQITTRRLACGMPLLVERVPGVKSVAISWLLPAGSATDPEDRQGLSTMWSEMIFRGVGGLDSRAQADALDRQGITRGASVGTHHLRLSFTTVADRLHGALPLLVDMARRPRFGAESIEPTRDLSLQSLESLADDPQERAVLSARERHNAPPLNRSGLGTEAGLRSITREDLVGGWGRRVRPVGSILGVAGAVDDPDALAAALDALLKGWEGAAEEVRPGLSATRGTYHHVEDDSSQVQIILMHDAPRESDPDCTAERLVATVLSGGMAARLFTEVREKRALCYSVSASYATDRDFGRVLAYVGTTPERAQESLDVLVAELERIGTPGGAVTPDEFARAITGIKSSLIFSGESTGARASALTSDFHRLGRARSLAEMAAEYDRASLDGVNAYLARRGTGPRTIVTLGPAALTPPV